MTVRSIVSNKTINLVLAIALFVAGVLFCVSPVLGEQWVSPVIGVAVLLIGAMTAVADFLKNKSLLSRTVIVGSVLAAIGIYLMVERSIVSKVIGVIPYVLIVTGACVLADGLMLRFVRDRQSSRQFVIEVSVGAAAIVLGGLILGISAFRSMLAVVIGIALAGGSGYYLYTTYKKEKKPAHAPAEQQATPAPAEPSADAKPAKESRPAKKTA